MTKRFTLCIILSCVLLLIGCFHSFYYTDKVLIHEDDRLMDIRKVGEWIYYKSLRTYGLYKIKIDGSKKVELTNYVSAFEIVDNTIYYIRNGIRKMSIDGDNNHTLTHGPTGYHFKIVREWIYYRDSNGGISKIKIDGTEKSQIISMKVSSKFEIKDKYIYFTSYENGGYNEGYIYKADLDGKNIIKLNNRLEPKPSKIIITDSTGNVTATDSEGNVVIIDFEGNIIESYKEDKKERLHYCFIIDIIGDWIYYKFDSEKIMRVKVDGTNKTLIGDEYKVRSASYEHIDGEWIYYSNKNDGCIYKIKLDGSDNTKLNSDISQIVMVDEEWIYYYNRSKIKNYRVPMYKIKKDGSKRKNMGKAWVKLDV